MVAHFYYVIIACQCYLIFPLIKKLFEKFDKIILILSLVSTVIFQAFVSFEYSDRFIGAYIFYFIFGMFFAKYIKKININKWFKFLIIPWVLIAITHLGFSYLSNIGKYVYSCSGLVNILYVTITMLILYAICKLLIEKYNKTTKLLEIINNDSYYIYLYHILLMHILQNDILIYFNLSIRNKFIVSTITVFLTIISIILLKNMLIEKAKARR